MEEVDAAARVEGGDGPVLLAVLEPGAAGRLPGRPRHERGDVLVVIVYGRIGGHNSLDALFLAFRDDFGHILRDVLAQGEDTSVSDRSIRAKEGFRVCVSCELNATNWNGRRLLTEVVGHAWKSARHVRLRCFCPQPVLEVTGSSHDRKPGAERVVKARSTDDSVDFNHFSRIKLDTLRHYPGDAIME